MIKSKIQSINPTNEGIDHINAYSKSNTKLGLFLSNWEYISNVDLVDGRFTSLENYWFWLKSGGNEEFRNLKPYQAKKLARELGIDGDLSKEHRIKFKEATWAKLISKCYFIKQEYKDLPILHYYNYNGKIIKAGPSWWVKYLNDILPVVIQLVDKIQPILLEKGWSSWYNEHYLINYSKNVNEYNGFHPIFAAIKEGIINPEDITNKEVWNK
jgi:hypothetical protein